MAVSERVRLAKLYLLFGYLIFSYFVQGRVVVGGSMMRVIWELFRVVWAVGCLPVGALLLIVVVLCGFNLPFFLGFASGADPAIRWLFWALAFYFVGGTWLFWHVNQRYAEKLRRQVAEFLAVGFHPHFEVFAKMSDAYLGIDASARRLLVYPVNGAEHFFRFDELNTWRIVPVGKRNHRLEVLTSNLDAPVFSIVLRSGEVLSTEARLVILLGS